MQEPPVLAAGPETASGRVLSEAELQELRRFFELLDEWDQKEKKPQ